MSANFVPLMEAFHGAILTRDAGPVLPAIKRNPRLAPERQMAIYIDGYRLRLAQTLRADYPALLALVGEEAFERLARDYIEANPPMHFNLDRYPHGFAAFVRGRTDDGFAAAIAAVEGAISEVFMMEESLALEAASLCGITPEAFGEMTLALRRASRLLRCDHPVNEWISAQRAGNVPPTPQKTMEFLYIYRHRNEVRRDVLPEGAYRLLSQLAKGLPLAQALEAAQTDAAHLQVWFADWLAKGFFRGENP